MSFEIYIDSRLVQTKETEQSARGWIETHIRVHKRVNKTHPHRIGNYKLVNSETGVVVEEWNNASK